MVSAVCDSFNLHITAFFYVPIKGRMRSLCQLWFLNTAIKQHSLNTTRSPRLLMVGARGEDGAPPVIHLLCTLWGFWLHLPTQQNKRKQRAGSLQVQV